MKNKFIPVLLTVLLLATGFTAFTQSVNFRKGLITASFHTGQGNIKVYLPDDIRPGDIISGRIIAEPLGKNPKQVEKNLASLKRYSVSFSGEKFSVASTGNPIKLSIPNNKPLSGRMELISDIKTLDGEVIDIKISSGAETNLPAECGIPTHALAASPLRITGPFDGDMGNTNCTLNDRPLEILAESPRQCIVSFPADAPGLGKLNVREKNNQLCTKNVSAVHLDVESGKLNLMKGEQTYVDVIITGLSTLADTATLTLNNITAGVVAMQPSDNVVISLTPGNTEASTFKKRFDILSKQTGTFTVDVNLYLPGDEMPQVFFEVKKLDKPRKLQDKALQIGLDMALKKLEADAGGARGKEYNTACQDCRDCISSRMGEWAADLIHDLGMIVIKEFAGKAISMIAESAERLKKVKEFIDKANEKIENAEKLGDELEDMIKKGELKYMAMKEVLCAKNKDCLNKADVFYNPSTGCVFAIITCRGTSKCCNGKETTFYVSYCTDEKGLPNTPVDIEVVIK